VEIWNVDAAIEHDFVDPGRLEKMLLD